MLLVFLANGVGCVVSLVRLFARLVMVLSGDGDFGRINGQEWMAMLLERQSVSHRGKRCLPCNLRQRSARGNPVSNPLACLPAV